MVDVSSLSPNPNVKIWTKLEGRNPAGSVKDRVALSLVESEAVNWALQLLDVAELLREPAWRPEPLLGLLLLKRLLQRARQRVPE